MRRKRFFRRSDSQFIGVSPCLLLPAGVCPPVTACPKKPFLPKQSLKCASWAGTSAHPTSDSKGSHRKEQSAFSSPPVPPYSDILRFRPDRTLLCNSPSPMIAISGKSTIPKRNFAPPNTMIFLFSVYCPAVTGQMGEALIFFRIRNRCHPDGFSLLIQRGDL